MKLIKVHPIDIQEALAFVDRADGSGSLETIKQDYYPPSEMGNLLRELRRANDISIKRASSILGIKPAELSGLETGRLTLSDPDWPLAFSKLLPGSKTK